MAVTKNALQVSVDRDFARFGSKSFAINKINTVDVKARHPHSQNSFFGWGLLSVICLLILVGGGQGAGSGGPAAALFISVVCGALAFRAWKRSKVVEYQLFLVTSSQAVQAIKSEDPEMIHGLRDRIERAIAGRLE
jgi:Family of unknown function (DUF6232)